MAIGTIQSTNASLNGSVTPMDLSFLRLLVPTWKLFDRPGAVPRLWVRSSTTEWFEWRPRYRRDLRTLFLNGDGNLQLSYASALERLLVTSDLETSADYLIVKEFARGLVASSSLTVDVDFQFRIDVVDPLNDQVSPYLLSPEYKLAEGGE